MSHFLRGPLLMCAYTYLSSLSCIWGVRVTAAGSSHLCCAGSSESGLWGLSSTWGSLVLLSDGILPCKVLTASLVLQLSQIHIPQNLLSLPFLGGIKIYLQCGAAITTVQFRALRLLKLTGDDLTDSLSSVPTAPMLLAVSVALTILGTLVSRTGDLLCLVWC